MKYIIVIECAVLTALYPALARADQPSAREDSQKTWTGALVAVDAEDNTVSGKHLFTRETFHLGRDCVISAVDKSRASLSDLRPGEKVAIQYQNAEGVLVANRINEKALSYSGAVYAVDETTHALTMEEPPICQPFRAPKQFCVAGDCQIILSNGGKGKLADVRPGDRVTIVYEFPDGAPVAYRIRKRTAVWVGSLDSINLATRILKARDRSGQTRFEVADGCRILDSGGRSGNLKRLAYGQTYLFTYEAVDGMKVVERIAPILETPPTTTVSMR